MTLSAVKAARVRRLSGTARYPQTFAERLADIPAKLADRLTAAEIAAVIDGPMESAHKAGRTADE